MFVHPLFFWTGAGLIAIPILIHILNRRRFKTVPWAAMEFLLRAMRKNRRRVQFEQLLLLAVRCLVLVFLGLALARPISCEDSTLAAMASRRTGLHVFVIDNSYSMAYEAPRGGAKTHLAHAKTLGKTMIDRLVAGGESVALITASSPASAVIVRPSYDLEGAKGAIDRIEQSYSDTDLVGALQQAVQIAREDARQPRRSLYLFTDATRSAWEAQQRDALAQLGPELAEQFRVTHFNLGKKGQWNQATLTVEPINRLVTTKFNNEFSAIVKGFGPDADASLQWKLDDSILPGGGTLRLNMDTPPQTQAQAVLRTGGPHVLSAVLIGEDKLSIDNTRWRVVDVASELKVLIVEGERGVGVLNGSGAYLEIALAPPKEAGSNNSGGKTDSYVQPEVVSDLELGNKVLTDYRTIILASVGQLTPSQADQVQKFVQQGGSLIIFMGEPVNRDAYNQVMLPRGLMPGTLTKRMSVAADQRPFLFDFKPQGNLHPMLNIFRDEEKSGLDTAQIFTYWQVELPADAKVEHVLDYLPNEGSGFRVQGSGNTGSTTSSLNPEPSTLNPDPAITVHSLGEGRVVFVSTTANSEWTSFTAKPAYVTLMHELLAGSITSGDEWMNVPVGRRLEVPASIKLTAAPTLTDPSQSQVVVEQITTSDGRAVYQSRPLTMPGVYQLATGSRTIPIAVNVPADEADVRIIDDAAIKRALGDIDLTLAADQVPEEAVSQRAGNDLGWTFMVLVLAFAATECFLAMKFGHYKRK